MAPWDFCRRPVHGGNVYRVVDNGELGAGERWTILLSVIVLGAGIAGYWYLAWPAKQINKHLDSEQYLAAAELANDERWRGAVLANLEDRLASVLAFDADRFLALAGRLEISEGLPQTIRSLTAAVSDKAGQFYA